MTVRVALVEDQTIFRELLAELLAHQMGFTVVAQVSTGQQALDELPGQVIDLLVLDVVLPDMSGLDVLRRLRASLRRVRVLLVTGHDRPDMVRDAVAAQVDGIVLKGTPLDELRAAIERVVAGGTYYCAASSRIIKQVAAQPALGQVLTPRERQIVQMVAEGLSSKQIAASMGVSAKTVANHRLNIMAKLGVKNAAGLARYAVEQGWLTTPR